ncbi:winged helix-turn-helix transcriptional regulator [Paenibacillus sp. FSL H3-0333]|uniref:winged helix-turn-helix transcriptional regulator n=1 Tax=Paenibacillus sp. FSL H3-0333 TaxID=2921373 RepID=UPI004046F213
MLILRKRVYRSLSNEDREKLLIAYDIIGSKWTIHILFTLSYGPKKFSEMTRSIPSITQRILSQRLKELQHHNLVRRTSPQRPTRTMYELTPKGVALATFIPCLMDWGTQN